MDGSAIDDYRPNVWVREEGGERQLRIDRTLASAYRPGRVETGSVWDALAAPVLLLERPRPRVAILGFGGGTVARVVRALAPDAEIVGVEASKEVLRVAEESFSLHELRVSLHHDDARAFVRQGAPFDLIVDDVFVADEGVLRKPDGMIDPGLRDARMRLRPSGLLATNCLEDLPMASAVLREEGAELGCFEFDDCDNRVLVAGAGVTPARLQRALRAAPSLARLRRNCRVVAPR
ncbi:MAG: methyltransferase domain-containing protein [Myxococcota bacterium]